MIESLLMAIPTKEQFEEGQVLLIDKPLHWTSFDVVKKIRNAIKVKKIGHAGTLDPLATGLLILCTGKFTKKIDTYQAQEKEYTGTITIGKTTPSYDLETEFDSICDFSGVSEQQLREAALTLTGIQEQVPPKYSAIKINGSPVYLQARKNQEVKMTPRQIEISTFNIEKIELPQVYFRIVCTKGTYIRSVAHDFGQIVGVGAHLSSLRRTRIGEFSVENAMQMEGFIDQIKAKS